MIQKRIKRKEIEYDFNKVSKIGGINIDKIDQINILEKLGFEILNKNQKLKVLIPSWRHDISEEVEHKLHDALGVEPTIHMDPVHPNDPLVQEVNKVLSLLCESDERIADIHDVRIVNTENHQVILFGINIQVGISQKEIVSCTLNLENRLKEKFKNYEINIKVSPLHRF